MKEGYAKCRLQMLLIVSPFAVCCIIHTLLLHTLHIPCVSCEEYRSLLYAMGVII